jgi:hypothetical protein
MRLLAAILALVLLAIAPAHAQKRAALVIGNAAYRNVIVTALLNPRNDANDIAASLTRLNFSIKKAIDGTFVTCDARSCSLVERPSESIE